MSKSGKSTTKSKIVASAWRLFYQHGYENTTVEEIIEDSGTSKGSFYHYFEGKDALLGSLASLFDERYEALADTLPAGGAMSTLMYLNRELFKMIEEEIDLGLLSRLYSAQLVTHGERQLLDHRRVYYKLLRRIIAEGQEKGEITREMLAAELARIYAMCERALIYEWCLSEGSYSLCEYSQAMLPRLIGFFTDGTK